MAESQRWQAGRAARWEQPARRRPSPLPAVAVAVASASLVGWLLAGGVGGDRGLPVDQEPQAVPTPAAGEGAGEVDVAPATPDPEARSPWRSLPHSPLVRRTGHSVTWTGREVIIWGGSRPDPSRLLDRHTHLGSGAAFDPLTERWRRLAPAPIPPRDGHTAAWSGEELLVWGGRAATTGPAGAAYDPSGSGWRELPAGPLDGVAAAGDGAWTGRELLLWAHHGERVELAAYDPAADAWRGLSGLAVPAGSTVDAVWAGDRLAVLVVAGSGAGSLYRYRPDADEWDRVEGRAFPQPEGFAAVGTTLVLWGHTSGEQFGQQWAAAVDVRTGDLRRLPGPSVRLAGDHVADSAGARLVLWDGKRGALLDLDRDSWVTLPDAPLSPRVQPEGVSTGDELIVWGGGDRRYYADGARLRLPGDSGLPSRSE